MQNTMSNRKFGVEIECFGMAMDQAAALLNAAGITCTVEGYGHSAPANWKIVTDSTVADGFELVSPILSGEEGLAMVTKVANLIEGAGLTVDRRCGFHVHVDARDLAGVDLVYIVKRYAKYETQIDAFMPKSRRENNNSYCKSLSDITFTSLSKKPTPSQVADYCYDRYRKVNVSAFLRHGTVEFRQHSGTVNAVKMTNWIQFCVNFVDTSKHTVNQVSEEQTTERKNSIEKKFLKLAELLDESESWRPVSVAQIASALEIAESSAPAYVSQLRTRYGVNVKVRRGRGYWLPGDSSAVGKVTNQRVSEAEYVAPENDNIFHGLAPQVVNYFNERSMELG